MWCVEVTDTFGGEANYSWVKRYELAQPAYDEHAKVKRYLVRAAKKLAGWTGYRCETNDMGDTIELRPRGMCQVMFIQWRDA